MQPYTEAGRQIANARDIDPDTHRWEIGTAAFDKLRQDTNPAVWHDDQPLFGLTIVVSASVPPDQIKIVQHPSRNLLKARKIAADYCRSINAYGWALKYQSGEWDDQPYVVIALRAMRDAS